MSHFLTSEAFCFGAFQKGWRIFITCESIFFRFCCYSKVGILPGTS
uniref:Macaca fascicularis brain cDNA clone: QmoA-12227, similar to human ubiquitin specific protease 48 (USP48), mRNA, RefSeq: NM_032236.3 n=1 Tax=Macaca fascicularis TaxID=9541 RepID=I7GJW8_MACFA|nr:unnamed protein product [Macaca fascicularis]